MNSKYKIKSLRIENYKSIENLEFNFNNLDLVVFDGPNGYGKTTVFEAIEIILTNELRKYTDSKQNAGYAFNNSPIHREEDKPINLTLILGNEEHIIHIRRHFSATDKERANKSKNVRQIFKDSKLYIDNEECSESDLENILNFNSIKTLFNVLNYVEQDENTFFLKKDPKERYSVLSSLLGAENEQKKLVRIKEKHAQIKAKVTALGEEITRVKNENLERFNTENISSNYKRLIDSQDFVWDKEEITNSDISELNSYLEQVDLIKSLVEQRDKLADIEFLVNIKHYANDSFLDIYIEYYWKLFNFEILENENKIRKKYEVSIRINESIISAIEKLNYNFLLSDNIWKYIKDPDWSFDKNELNIKLKLVISKISALGEHEKILNNLKDKQTQLLALFKQHESSIPLEAGECPTCGFNWNSSDELNASVQETLNRIFEDYIKGNAELETLKNEIYNGYLKEVKEKLTANNEEYNSLFKSLITQEEFALLSDKISNKSKITKFLSLFESSIQEEIISKVNYRTIEDFEVIKGSINSLIESNTPTLNLDEEQMTIYWRNFEHYFNADYIKISNVQKEDIVDKKEYITSQYYLAINKRLNSLYKRLGELNKIEDQVKRISDHFTDKIKKYTKDIVDNISIPFYIFTGKILQQHTLGSGLILDLKTDYENSILKINPRNRDQEVSYTLSSGQLSATVISLTLVLNKVYNYPRLATILIDDPLQTLDDINTHSLIEVLKYNFANQQVLLSTHEERYSKLIRYKYDRFSLDADHFSMKDMIS